MKKIKYIIFLGLMSFLGINNIYAEDICAVCGSESLPIPIGVPNFVSKLILLAQIAVPILIIIVAMFKYTKAITSNDDKAIKEANSSFIRSLITGVSVFLIVTFVKFAFNLLGSEYSDSLNCISCFLSGEEYCSTQSCPDRDMNNGSEESDSEKSDSGKSSTHTSSSGREHGGG